jgi:O-acetyl-ADP-ribose deacetylase (regulator of RNase III)
VTTFQAAAVRWVLTCGDILDLPADVLVCSANVYLNLSGGVGGEILRRYGDRMQRELHDYLRDRNLRFVPPGAVVRTSPCGTPFRDVLHAVAVDGFYQSSPARVRQVVETALTVAASLGARRVALTALATGYGRLSMRRFAEGIAPLTALEFPPLSEVFVCVRHADQLKELAAALPNIPAD